jgi:NADH dehydrogenase FAD-containing subunit
MEKSIIVIGAGVAGISACLHIGDTNPAWRITLVSDHSPMEPSGDYSKIVRVDYENEERMREAQKAQNAWKSGSFAPYYSECGRLSLLC